MKYLLYNENKNNAVINTNDKEDFIKQLKMLLVKESYYWACENKNEDNFEDTLKDTFETLTTNDIEELANDLNAYWCGYGLEITL